jgi:hypothetical protein
MCIKSGSFRRRAGDEVWKGVAIRKNKSAGLSPILRGDADRQRGAFL